MTRVAHSDLRMEKQAFVEALHSSEITFPELSSHLSRQEMNLDGFVYEMAFANRLMREAKICAALGNSPRAIELATTALLQKDVAYTVLIHERDPAKAAEKMFNLESKYSRFIGNYGFNRCNYLGLGVTVQ